MKKGFTLAEVLITLGIIGVVAAITLPTVIQNYQEKAVINSLKKNYSILSQSFEYANMKYGDPTEWELPEQHSSKNLDNLGKLFENIKTVKTCKGTFEGCGIIGTYTNLDGTKQTNNEIMYAINTLDGSWISIVSRSNSCSDKRGPDKHLQNICAIISVDINGQKGPNINSKDKFHFYLTKFGIYPAGTQNDNKLTFKGGNYTCLNDGACTAWVLINKNMDYLHCYDKLSWTGKTSCKY